MSLTCWCDDDSPEDIKWWWCDPVDFSVAPQRKRRARCIGCKALIDHGSDVLKFRRHRYARDDVELRIYDEEGEIEMASWLLCEECGGLWLSLTELGFCVQPDEVREDAADYAVEHGRKRT